MYDVWRAMVCFLCGGIFVGESSGEERNVKVEVAHLILKNYTSKEQPIKHLQ